MAYKTTWDRIRVEATTDPWGGLNSEQGVPYPTWWPNRATFKESSRIEISYGFPYLSWWELERGVLFNKMPKMNLENMSCPSKTMFDTMEKVAELGRQWQTSSQVLPTGRTPKEEWLQWVEPLCRFWDSGDEGGNTIWGSWLLENCLLQLQFFGVPLYGYNSSKIFNSSSNFFKNPLKFIPGKWEIMVTYSLMVVVVHLIQKNIFTPFLPWKNSNDQFHYLNQEPSVFQFPILTWMKTKNIQQIKIVLGNIRGKNENLWNGNRVEAPVPGVLSYLTCFSLFVKFYESDGFRNLKDDEIYYILDAPLFRNYYAFMIWMSSLKVPGQPLLNFSTINRPNNILGNPYVNERSVNDFMMWSLMAMYVDAFNSNVDSSVNVRKILNEQPIDQKAYDDLFTNRLKSNQLTYHYQPQQVVPPPPPVIPGGIKTGIAVPESATRERNMIKEFGIPVDYQKITNVSNLQLDRWLSDFRVTWRKTAIWNFLGIGDQKWVPEMFQYHHFPKKSKEEKIVLFIRNNFPRRLRIPRFNFLEMTRMDSGWEDAYKYQFELYLEWVVLNVNVEDSEKYILPGSTFVDGDGSPKEVVDGEEKVLLKNSFPDIMMEREQTLPGKAFQVGVSIAFVFLNAALESGFGSDWKDFLSNFGKKIWAAVKEALIALAEAAVEAAKAVANAINNALPDLKWYLIAGVAGVAVVMGGWTFADEEIRKLAR